MMKTTNWILAILATSVLVFAGCSKSSSSTKVEAPKVNNVTVDVPKLQAAFAGVNDPEIQGALTAVNFGLRYGQYMNSVVALDKLANNPNVTEPQKKVVNELIDQFKQVIASSQAAPAQ